MPTYVYKFIETDETIEVQQSFSDATLTEIAHPETGVTMPVKKVFLPVGVTFKGDGFYKTDSRASAKKKSTSSSNGDAGSSPSSESSSVSESSGSSSSEKSASPTTTATTTSTSGTSGTSGD